MSELTEAQKTWAASPTGWTSAKGETPGTREFFDKARHFRDTIEQPWLGDVVDFESARGKRVLEIGFGPGYDALKFMQAGADYSGIDITTENVDRTRKHLSYFNLSPDVRQGDAEHSPYSDGSFDLVYSNGVLHHIPDLTAALGEIRRVLKPDGRLSILMYHRNSVFYVGLVLSHFITGRFFRESLRDRRSRIEHTTADAKPIVNVYSRRELRGLLTRAGFNVQHIAARKVTPDDFPGAGRFPAAVRLIPQSSLDLLGQYAGWYLIATAVR